MMYFAMVSRSKALCFTYREITRTLAYTKHNLYRITLILHHVHRLYFEDDEHENYVISPENRSKK